MSACVYLGLGANLGDRKQQLENALQKLSKLSSTPIEVSSIYETPALLPENAVSSWNKPYWNLVAKITVDQMEPRTLLGLVKQIEVDLGRTPAERWAPRAIDIDLLIWDGITLADPELTLPHSEITRRAFVLDPLSELAPSLRIHHQPVIDLARAHANHTPRLMGILNLTPDSFSNQGHFPDDSELKKTSLAWADAGISLIDLGAESTRPGARTLSTEEEWARLETPLQCLQNEFSQQLIRPGISVDTRNAKSAARALELGASVINDVSHFSDPEMLAVLKSHACRVVLMHSLSVPADPKKLLAEPVDAVAEISEWFNTQVEMLDRCGISPDRVILDPGIGFGKTSLQSLALLKSIQSFQKFGCTVLAGHSRKSFMKDWSSAASFDRDLETLGISLALVTKGIDLLRVHDPVSHQRALLAWSHTL